MTTSTIAFLGLGAMGAPMAKNLMSAGFRLRVWNRTPGKAAALVGAQVAPTPRDAAAGADFAITMLADDTAVEGVTFGPNGLLDGLGENAVHVGMSTISLALSRRLALEHAQARREYVAAPVFGRPDAAAARKLWIVVGGADAIIARCAPIFSALGQGIFPMGTAAQASLAKLAGNYLIAATIESVGEALVLGEKGDINPERLFVMLSGTLFGSPVFNGYGNRIAKTEFIPAGFTMILGLKDVVLALAAARDLGSPMPVAELARSRLLTAIERGWGDHDFAGFASVIREEAGLPGVRA